MEELGHTASLEAIIIGRFTDNFVHFAMNLLGEYGIEFILCDDIYWASCELAKKVYGNVLVIGRTEQLSRERGRFLSKIKEKGFFCCCIANNCSTQKLKSLTETGAFIINTPAQIGEVVMKLLANNGTRLSGKKTTHKASDFKRNEFITTKAEIDALLGT